MSVELAPIGGGKDIPREAAAAEIGRERKNRLAAAAGRRAMGIADGDEEPLAVA